MYKDVSLENPWIKYIQMCVSVVVPPCLARELTFCDASFENKGTMMGCSNPHPHGQAWSLSYVPSIPQTMLESQRKWAFEWRGKQKSGVPTLCVFVLFVRGKFLLD